MVIVQVGACIVNDDNIILSIGYNGFPRGCADSSLPWSKRAKSGSILDTKYPYVSTCSCALQYFCSMQLPCAFSQDSF